MKIAFVIYHYSRNHVGQRSVSNRTHNTPPAVTAAAAISESPSSGGVERYVANLTEEFVRSGHEVHIFCHKSVSRKWHEDAPLNGVMFHHVPAVGLWSPLKIWSFAIASFLVLRWRQEEFDIIHGFGKTFFQDVLRIGGGSHLDFMKRTYPLMANPFLRFLVILNPRHFANLLLEWVMIRRWLTKRVVCNSCMCRDEFMGRYNINEGVIDVIYNGVDAERFVPVNKIAAREQLVRESCFPENALHSDELFVLFVGSGFRRKGLRHAIAALAMLDTGVKVRLLVVGRGRFEGYGELAERLGVAEMITCVGASGDVREIYDACDIFLLPTEYDAFPNACLEAMSMGLPVIVSRSSGVAEIIEDGVDGIVIDYPIEPEEIARRIEQLAVERKRADMGLMARQKALTFSVQANAEKTLDLYRQVLAERG